MASLKITYDKNDPGRIRRIEAKGCLSLTVTHLNGRRAVLDLDGEQFLVRATNPKAYGLLLFHDTEEQLNHVDEIVLKGQHDLTVRRSGPGVFVIEHTYGAPLQPGQESSPQMDSPYSFAQGTRKDHEGAIILEHRKPPKSRRPTATQS